MNILPWYIAGPLIGLMVPLLLFLREKQLGLSSTYRYFGSFFLPKNSYLNYPRINDAWQVQFAAGILIASIVIFQFDLRPEPTVELALANGHAITEVYSLDHWYLFLFGGIFVGFGSRYAGGCTAGHCIMGNSILSVPSMISTVMFFIGGLIITYFVLPYIV